jgi:hypothetical protein
MKLKRGQRVKLRDNRLWWRSVGFMAASAAGITLGVLGQLLSRDSFSAHDVIGGIVLSPIAVTVGGGAVTIPEIDWEDWFFVPAGCLFWPAYAVFAWYWFMRKPRWSFLWLVTVWCAQGFFQVAFRLQGIMAV